MALEKMLFPVDFTRSLDTRTGKKLVLGGKSTIAQDMIYRGKVVERRTGFSSLGQSIAGGGTLAGTDPLLAGYVLGNTLAIQKKDFYTWDPQGSSWQKHGRGFNLNAISKSIAYRSIAPVNSSDVDTINGYTCYLWNDGTSTTNIRARVLNEATQAQIGDVIVLSSSNNPNVPRLVALGNVFLAFWPEVTTNTIRFSRFDTTNPGAGWSAAATLSTPSTTNQNSGLDAIVVNGRCFVTYRLGAGNTANIVEVNSSGAIIAGPVDTTAVCAGATYLGKSLDNFIFVLTDTGASNLQRTILNLSLTITSAVATVGATSALIPLVNRVTSLANTSSCDVYFSYGNTGPQPQNHIVQYSSLTSAGGIGAVQNFVRGSAVASAPFLDSAGRRYIWLFSRWGISNPAYPYGQNTLNQSVGLFEDLNQDATSYRYVGQALYGNARGGLDLTSTIKPSKVLQDSAGRPFIIAQDQFILNLSSGTNTSAIGISRLTVSTQASAPLTKTTTGGLILQACGAPSLWDGDSVVEAGFAQYPEVIVLTNVVGGGSLSAGTYGYTATYEFVDLTGNRWQSAAAPAQFVTAALNDRTTVTLPYLRWTNKSTAGARVQPRIVPWRTVANGSTYFRALPLTDSSLINNVGLDTVNFTDGLSDAALQSNEILYTSKALANIAPPACQYVVPHQNRLFLLGLEDKNSIWYSRKIIAQDGINFSDVLNLRVDGPGGDVTGGASLDEKFLIFRQTRTDYIAGDGPNDLGTNSSFTPQPQSLYPETGCVDGRTIVKFPFGVLFLSKKGFYLASRNQEPLYLGAPVEGLVNAFGQPQLTFTSAQVLTTKNQVRWTTAQGLCIVLDYQDVVAADIDQQNADKFKWSTFQNYAANDAVIWNDAFTQIGADNFVCVDSDTANSDQRGTVSGISGTVETAWLHVAGIQGFQRIWKALFAGATNLSTHNPSISVGYNFLEPYEYTFGYRPTVVFWAGQWWFVPQPLPTAEPMQFRHDLQRQECEAVRFKIMFPGEIGQAPWRLENLTLECGMEKGAFRVPPDSRLP